ncbi:hypothetical protein D0865_03696 [Hortaea werneckii]|uniref:Uncharacterized protein n=1 Tax=Hortaea werneckii TaxID=91943 RepID=A0A3M7CW85_HORWE|nr:hypothetical protein D0865_03696 [Hortaea werneckii]
MNAGAGFHNTGREEGASPSLDISQHSAKNAGVEPPRDVGQQELTPDRPNTTQPNEHYVYEVDLFRSLSFLVDRALEELTYSMGNLIEVVEIPKQRHSKGPDVPYTELCDLPPSKEKMRWQNVIMQLQPSSTPKKTRQVFMKAIDSFEFDAAVTARQIIRGLSQTFDSLAFAGRQFLQNSDPFIHDWLTIHSKAKQWANEGILPRKTRVCHTYQDMALTALLELNEDLRQFHAHTRKAYADVQSALSIATAVDSKWGSHSRPAKDKTIASLHEMAKNG